MRVPTRFPIPLIGFCAKNIGTIQSAADGSFTFVFIPSATNTLVVTSISASAAAGDLTFSDMQTTLLGNTTNRVKIAKCCTDVQLSSRLSNFRVVCGGVSIANNVDFADVKGRIVCSPLIMPRAVIDDTAVGLLNSGVTNSTAYSYQQYVSGINNNGFAQASMSIPGSFEIRLDQMINKSVVLATRPVTPDGYRMRYCDGLSSSLGSGYNVIGASDLVGTVSGLTTSNNRNEGSDASGMMGWIVSGFGCPATTNCLDIVTSMNFEGQYEGQATAGALQPTGHSKHTTTSRGFNLETLLSMLPPSAATIASEAAIMGLQNLMGPVGRGFMNSIMKDL